MHPLQFALFVLQTLALGDGRKTFLGWQSGWDVEIANEAGTGSKSEKPVEDLIALGMGSILTRFDDSDVLAQRSDKTGIG